MTEEKRVFRRFSIPEEDDVLCILIQSASSGASIILPAMDISERGIKFMADEETNEYFFIWEKLYLKEIIGTQNVIFKDPIELIVRWQENGVEKKAFGCEISCISQEAEKQYRQFIQAAKADSEVASGELTRRWDEPSQKPKDQEETVFSKTRDRRALPSEAALIQLWAIVAGVVFVIMTVVSVGYTYHHTKRLSQSLGRLGKEVQQVSSRMGSAGKVDARLASIEESLFKLKDLVRQNQNAYIILDTKIKNLQQRQTASPAMKDKEPPPGVSSPPEEKPGSPAPKETASEKRPDRSFHEVQKGENLFRISVKYNRSLERLAEINDMKVDDPIYPGQRLKLP